jgi:hypothetical protein
MSTRSSLLLHVARRTSVAFLTCALLSAVLTRQAAASGPDETALDSAALTQMEVRADHAMAHDQCFLYTELIHGLTELAGRQMAAGQDDEAAATMRQVDLIAGKIQTTTGKDTKKLKNAELLLEHTSHRLADMLRVASSEQKLLMQSALQHLNSAHTSVLAMVFAH